MRLRVNKKVEKIIFFNWRPLLNYSLIDKSDVLFESLDQEMLNDIILVALMIKQKEWVPFKN